MTQINRREFVERAAAAAGALVVGAPALAVPQKARRLSERVKLGRTGIETSLVAMGTGSIGYNHSSNQTRLGQEKFNGLVSAAWDAGVRFFDVADSYGSHPFLHHAIRGLPREQMVIMTKTFNRTPEGVRADIERFLKELGTDYVDILLMHCVTEPDWNVRYEGVKDVISEAKRKGMVRAHGCSCHSFAAMEAAAADPWVEVDLARINPWAMHMDARRQGESREETCQNVKALLKRMKDSGKGVIGMKILGQGDAMKGSDRLERIQETLRFALSSNAIHAMSIGFESPAQIAEIMRETRVAIAEINRQLS